MKNLYEKLIRFTSDPEKFQFILFLHLLPVYNIDAVDLRFKSMKISLPAYEN